MVHGIYIMMSPVAFPQSRTKNYVIFISFDRVTPLQVCSANVFTFEPGTNICRTLGKPRSMVTIT